MEIKMVGMFCLQLHLIYGNEWWVGFACDNRRADKVAIWVLRHCHLSELYEILAHTIRYSFDKNYLSYLALFESF